MTSRKVRPTVKSRRVKVALEDAPRTEGYTSGLTLRTIEPAQAIFTYYSAGDVRARLSGPGVRTDGSLGVGVMVSFGWGPTADRSPGLFAEPPEWLRELAEDVR